MSERIRSHEIPRRMAVASRKLETPAKRAKCTAPLIPRFTEWAASIMQAALNAGRADFNRQLFQGWTDC